MARLTRTETNEAEGAAAGEQAEAATPSVRPPLGMESPGDEWRIIAGGSEASRERMGVGLRNIAQIAAEPILLPHKVFSPGFLGFRKADREKEIRLVLACGKEPVRKMKLRQLVALVELVNDPEHNGTVLLENLIEGGGERNSAGRGQVLARIDPRHSAFTVVQGIVGRVIRGPGDIVLHNVYYVPRYQIQAAYVMAVCQLGIDDELQNLLELYEGWREFSLPLNLCSPGH